MSLDLLVLLPIAIGHAALFIYVFNVVHAFGHSERILTPVKIGFLVLFPLVSAWLGWEAWHGSILTRDWSRFALGYAAICFVTGLVFFPAATAYLHFRPTPLVEHVRVQEVDLAATLGAETLIGNGRYASLLKVPGNKSLRLQKLEWELPLATLPPALDGLSILHLTDFHLAPCYKRRFFEAVVDEAATMEADLTLFTGDLVDDDAAIEWVVPLLSRVRGRLGSFATLGNHDLEHQPERLRKLVEEAGFIDLEGLWTTLALENGLTLAVGGTSYPWGPRLSVADRPQADFRILLSHTPDQFYWAERAGFDLMFSGHNHGGQIRFPLIGPVFMPSVYSRRFDRGFFRKNGLTLHVSQGVAGKHPIRFGCVPEIGRLVLRSAPSGLRDASRGGSVGHHEQEVR